MLSPTLKSGETRSPRSPPIDARECNRKIQPDRYKPVISGMLNPFSRADQQNYVRFPTYYSKHATFLGWQSVFLTENSVRIGINPYH